MFEVFLYLLIYIYKIIEGLGLKVMSFFLLSPKTILKEFKRFKNLNP